MTTSPPADTAGKPKHQRIGVSEAMDLAAKAHQSTLSGKTPLPAFKPYTPEPAAEPSDATKPAAAGGRDIRSIPLDLIDENPFAPREVYAPEVLRDRAESLRVNGQYEVIHVIPHPDKPGRFMIADGWTRVTASRLHQVTESLEAQVHHDLAPMQAAWLGYNHNESREQHCDLDRAFFFDKMYAQGMTQAEVAKKTGISQTQLSFYTAYRKLPDETLQVIRLDPKRFPAYIAQNLAKVARKVSEDKASSLASIFRTNGQSVNWMINQCALLLDKEPRSSQKKQVGKVFRYSNGTLKQKGMQFDLSLTIEETEQEEFSKALEQLLGRFGKSPVADAQDAQEQE